MGKDESSRRFGRSRQRAAIGAENGGASMLDAGSIKVLEELVRLQKWLGLGGGLV